MRVGSRAALVDELLVPLVREMWLAGIDTANSCQDAGDMMREPRLSGHVFMQFADAASAERFLDLVADAPVRRRQPNGGRPAWVPSSPGAPAVTRWLYGVVPWDENVRIRASGVSAPAAHRLRINVIFPASDVETCRARLASTRAGRPQLG